MKQLFKQSLPHIVAVAIFFIASYAYFSPLIEGKGLKQHDIEQFRGSAKEIMDYREATGEEPLWTNSMFSGMPAYLISTRFEGNKLTFVDHILQLGKRPASFIFFTLLGFYILMLVMRVNPWLSIVGAFAYGLSSYFFIVIAAGHNAKIHAISYVAPMIAGMVLAFRGKYLGGLALFGLFLGLNLNAGHVQITYYAGFVMVAMTIAYFIDAAIRKEYIRFSKAIGVLAIAGILALGANFSRLYFTYDYGKDSIRGATELTSREDDRTTGLDKKYATDWSYGIAESFNMLIPNLMGGSSMGDLGTDSHTYQFLQDNGVPKAQARQLVQSLPVYWGPQPMTSGPVYIGAIVVFLFMLGLLTVRGSFKWAILGVTILGIMLAWGKNFMPLTDFFLHYFPGYNKFRTVSMILYIAEFTMPLLGMMAVKQVYDGELTNERFMNGLKWSLGIVGGICLLFILMGGTLFHFEAEMDQMYIQAGYPPELFGAIRTDRAALLRADAIRSLAFVLLGAGSIYALQYKKVKPAYFIAILGVLIVADMWVINRRYLNNDNFENITRVEVPFTPTNADKQILADTTLYFRVFNLTVSTFNDANTSYFHKSLGGYHGAKLRRYQEIIDHHLSKQNPKVVDMLNTRYIIARRGESIVAMQNPGALGNAWFVDSFSMVENADEEIEALNNFNPAREAIVDRRFAEFVPNESLSPVDSTDLIELTSYSANRLTYKYKASSERFTVFSDIYYPKGWTAYVDGEKADHFRVNYILRAMILPEGKHEVTFEFKPKMFNAGYTIDLVSSLLLIVVTLAWVALDYFKPLINKK
ncbi:MAG TPA: YfhO family protein [Tenuifilaceae bacterium]|nr:YfhO family protein [Tenuifilaceae bacterium]